MSEGVTLLIIISMLAAASFSVMAVERKESALLDDGGSKRLPMLASCDLLFAGSFCVVLFYMYMEKLINPEYVSAGWQIGLAAVIIAHLSFGVRRFWRIYKKKPESGKQKRPGGFGTYMQYALIYMALALLVILASELLVCALLDGMDRKILLKNGQEIVFGLVRQQLLGALLVCSLTGFILTTARAGQEAELSKRQGRRDKLEEVKRYLRQ